MGGAKPGKCFKCGQEGHWARQCPVQTVGLIAEVAPVLQVTEERASILWGRADVRVGATHEGTRTGDPCYSPFMGVIVEEIDSDGSGPTRPAIAETAYPDTHQGDGNTINTPNTNTNIASTTTTTTTATTLPTAAAYYDIHRRSAEALAACEAEWDLVEGRRAAGPTYTSAQCAPSGGDSEGTPTYGALAGGGAQVLKVQIPIKSTGVDQGWTRCGYCVKTPPPRSGLLGPLKGPTQGRAAMPCSSNNNKQHTPDQPPKV